MAASVGLGLGGSCTAASVTASRPRVGRRRTATICQELCQGSKGCPSRQRRCALPPKALGGEAAEIQNGPRYLSQRGPWLRTARSIGDVEFLDLALFSAQKIGLLALSHL